MQPSAEWISPNQAARAMGVSESSLKRWCDQGLIKLVRTAGGHRKLSRADVLRFIRERDQPLASPEVLGLPAVSPLAELGLKLRPAATGRGAAERRRVLSRGKLCSVYTWRGTRSA